MEREAIKEAVKEALGEELKAFYIDRETHYQHHQLIGNWSKTIKKCQNVVMTTIVIIVVGGLMGLMSVGIWLKQGK